MGLPFLESVPHRSAWAQGEEPRFALFIATMCGVETSRFWPSEDGALTNLAEDTHAASVLADFADVLLFPRDVTYPTGYTFSCPHAEALSMMFTGAPPQGSSSNAVSTAPSIDTILAPHLNPGGIEPMALYAGMKAGYINERISFVDAGVVRAAEGNPYQAYQDLLRSFMPDPGTGDATLDELTARRASAVDLVRDELDTFLGRSGIGAEDRQRLQLHMDSLRDIEKNLGDMQDGPGTLGCSQDIVDEPALEAVQDTYRKNGTNEAIAKLQLDIVTFAFACNLNRVATLQTGDGSDETVYDVPSNERGWRLHYICNRTESDGSSGNDQLAVEAQAEIDVVRLETLRHGLERFAERDLLDKSLIYWANELSACPAHSMRDLPIILAGNPGGALNTGRQVRFSSSGFGTSVPNGALLTTVAHVLGVDEPIGVAEDAALLDELLA
jgi:hypothetical protein